MQERSPLDEDISLIQRFKEGDSSAFDELVIKHQSKVFNTAYRMLSSYEDANDMAQEVFIRAYKSLLKFRGDSKFYTWLYRITVNSCINKLKSQKRTISLSYCAQSGARIEPTLAHSHDGGPMNKLERRELQRHVQNAISSLPDRYRCVVVLRDIQGLHYQEIAKVMECSLEAVRSSLYRARKKLKRELKHIAPLIMNGVKEGTK